MSRLSFVLDLARGALYDATRDLRLMRDVARDIASSLVFLGEELRALREVQTTLARIQIETTSATCANESCLDDYKNRRYLNGDVAKCAHCDTPNPRHAEWRKLGGAR